MKGLFKKYNEWIIYDVIYLIILFLVLFIYYVDVYKLNYFQNLEPVPMFMGDIDTISEVISFIIIGISVGALIIGMLSIPITFVIIVSLIRSIKTSDKKIPNKKFVYCIIILTILLTCIESYGIYSFIYNHIISAIIP